MTESPLSGVIVLDKPSGVSSNHALTRVKHLLGRAHPELDLRRRRQGVKFGFLGTLDPLATGVLPLFVGKATKLISAFEGLDKTYRVTLRLGQRTDTFDAEGRVLEERPLDGLAPDAVRAAIVACAGEQVQRVPAFSAVKIGGVPAYRLARTGQAVPVRERTVRLWDLEVESVTLPEAVFRVSCGAGTYMRALAEQLGQTLGVGAHVLALRRLACGSLFALENSYTLERLEQEVEQEGSEGRSEYRSQYLCNPADFLPDHRSLTIAPELEPLLRDGRAIPLSGVENPSVAIGRAGVGNGAVDIDRQSAAIADAEDEGTDSVVRAEYENAAPVKALRPCGTLLAVGQIVTLPGSGGLGFQPSKVLL